MAKQTAPKRVVEKVWVPAWEIVCEYCGRTAVVRRSDARFCSPSHRVMAHRKRAAHSRRTQEGGQ